jgi:hypothetical protein
MVVTAVRDTIRKMNAPPSSPEPAEDAGPVHRVPAPSVLAEMHAPARAYRERSDGSGSANGHAHTYRDGSSANGRAYSNSGANGGTQTYREPEGPAQAYREAEGSVLSASPAGSQLGHYDGRPHAYAGSADYYDSPEREQWRQPAMGPAYRAGLDQ